MRRLNLKHSLCLCAVALCWMLPASLLAADECDSDADCDEGFICESYTAPCPAVDCSPDDTDCGSCEPEEVKECAPAPPDECDSAADCSGDLVCVTYTREMCSDATEPACAPGEACADAGTSESECTTETQGYCLPPYLAPCETDSDCGAGFACKEAEMCSCSGGGSTGGSGGGSVDPDGDSVDAGSGDDAAESDAGWVVEEDAGSGDAGSWQDDCTCSGSGEFYCELQEQECTADSECPGDLICDEVPWASDGGTVCTSDPNGNTSCEEEPADDTEYCQPEDLERWVGIGGGSASGSAEFARGADDDGGGESGQLVSSDVDRGSSGGGSSGGSSSACASAGPLGATPTGALMAGLLVLVLGLVRRKRQA
jgi:hypothetical protein